MAGMEIKPSSSASKPAYPLFAAVAAAAASLFAACDRQPQQIMGDVPSHRAVDEGQQATTGTPTAPESTAPAKDGDDDIQALGGDVCAPAPGSEE